MSIYSKLQKICEDFPFFKDSLSGTNFFKAYDANSANDIEQFLADYDTNSDLFNYVDGYRSTISYYRSTPSHVKYFEDKMKHVTMNYINDLMQQYSFTVSEKALYTSLKKLHELMDDFKPELNSDLSRSFFSVMNEITNKIINKYFALVDEENKNMFFRISNEPNDIEIQLDSLIVKLDLVRTSGYTPNMFTINYDIRDRVENFIKNMYNTYTTSDIKVVVERLDKIPNIMKSLPQYKREISVLNTALSDEEKAEFLKSFTSASKIKELASEIKKKSIRDFSVISEVIESVIINNKKIRDLDYPKTKNKVVSSFIKQLLSEGTSLVFDTKTSDYDDFIDKYEDYLLDPLFLCGICMQEQVIKDQYRDIVRNTKSLVKYLLKDEKRLELFLNRAFDLLEEPNREKYHSVINNYQMSDIHYGTIDYILHMYSQSGDSCIDNVKRWSHKQSRLNRQIYGLIPDARNHVKELLKETDISEDIISRRNNNLSPFLSQFNNLNNVIYYSDGREDYTASSMNSLSNSTKIFAYINGDIDLFLRCLHVDSASRYGGYYYRSERELKNAESKKYAPIAYTLFVISLYEKYIDEYSDEKTEEEMLAAKVYLFNNIKSLMLIPTGNAKKRNVKDDETNYINYIDIAGIEIYCLMHNLNKKYDNLFNIIVPEDVVFVPEYATATYYRLDSSGQIAVFNNNGYYWGDSSNSEEGYDNRLQVLHDTFESKENLTFLKQILVDNLGVFEMDRATEILGQIQASIDGDRYNDTDIVKRLYREENSTTPTKNTFQAFKLFYNNLLIPKLIEYEFITEEESNTLKTDISNAEMSYECYKSIS